jgi:hypothetical protein
MDQTSPSPGKPTALDWFFRALGFATLVAGAFTLPSFPSAGLDDSWRMALGKFFQEGRQFGTEVVFTYGPLGFQMGKTYWGGQWGSLIAWQVVQAFIAAGMVYWYGLRLNGYSRAAFFIFFFIWGLSYEDALHQILIALGGCEIIRRSNAPWRWDTAALILLLAISSLVKFTNLVLCLALVTLAGGLELWTRRRAAAVRVPFIFLAMFLLGWVLCGQSLANLPAYFHSSWEISQGYQDVMGFSCPPRQLYVGLITLVLIVTYAALNFATHGDRVRSFALSAGVGAFIYLNWKHGFIRADGHQIGFYYAALTLAVTGPLLLEESARLRVVKKALLTAIAAASLIGMEFVLPGVVRGALGGAQYEIDRNVSFFLGQSHTRELYDVRLRGERDGAEMLKTKALVGQASVDVLGFEQSVALFNGFNYQPRPVFQGYSAYTPYLSRVNHEYYASDRAPEFVLFKLQTLDGRLHTMDDPLSLRVLIQRYTYLFTEQGFTVWQRKPGPFDAADFEPVPVRTATVRVGQKLDLAELSTQNLWVEIDYRFSLVGKLRRFFFKPPLVQLRITDDRGFETVHRLPQPIGRAGFMLNPVTDDLLEFMRAAGGEPKRRAASIVVECAPQDRDCLQPDIQVRLATVAKSDAGVNYFKEADKTLFHMFVDTPASFQALNPPNEDLIDKRKVMIMHAPSEMVFDVPAGATEMHGSYGFIPGAYSNGGRTNGAEFVIYWSSGSEPTILHERYLDPVKSMNDRGLQKFFVKLPKSTGRVHLRINPGPFGEYAFDWTGWSGIEFK